MSHWINSEINLGIIRAGSPRKLIFKASETLPVIKTISPYCGCTATSYNEATKELTITYSNSAIPDQVQGAQTITKRIDIIYEDDSSDILIIKATRTR
jgi:hypothetical protein